MQMGKCKTCQANIAWIVGKGKPQIVNAKPKIVWVANEDEFGNLNFWELVRGYESHFSTCPNATQHRVVRQSTRNGEFEK